MDGISPLMVNSEHETPEEAAITASAPSLCGHSALTQAPLREAQAVSQLAAGGARIHVGSIVAVAVTGGVTELEGVVVGVFEGVLVCVDVALAVSVFEGV